MPGGGTGGRDHAFFGEYAPWDHLNSSTLAYLGSDANSILVMYVPVRRLLKYRSSLTYNGDVVVRDVVPFHEVHDVWIAGKSPDLGGGLSIILRFMKPLSESESGLLGQGNCNQNVEHVNRLLCFREQHVYSQHAPQFAMVKPYVPCCNSSSLPGGNMKDHASMSNVSI